jgi:hypothetical protein
MMKADLVPEAQIESIIAQVKSALTKVNFEQWFATSAVT